MAGKRIKDFKIAVIMDEFSYNCFKYECNLKMIRRKSWRKDLASDKFDLLFVESAWEGNNGLWKESIINLHTKKNTILKNVVDWCKDHKIPTVFWNKEDPAHFYKFLGAATYFDYVFTSDSRSVNKYKKILNHNRVYELPFAAQPRIHNPVNRNHSKKGKIAFAGSWYAKQHQDRKTALHNLLIPAMKYKLDIYDRNSNWKTLKFRYPKMYDSYIKPRVKYAAMVQLYKRYDIFLNVNTIVNSPTMFSRRIYELLACGTNVVSNKSIGMEQCFGNIVKVANTREAAANAYKSLLGSREIRERLSLRGQRAVFTRHTYHNRLKYILKKVSIKYIDDANKGVSIITCTNKSNMIDYILRNYDRQSYKKKELIIIINKDSIDINECKQKAAGYKNVSVYKLPEEKTLGACLNFGVAKCKHGYISKFDDDNFYGVHFIGDLMNAFKYTKADIVGKMTYFTFLDKSKTFAVRFPENEYKYTDFLSGSAMIINKKVFKKVKFIDKSIGEDTVFLKDCIKNGFKMYSADKYNYIVYRKGSASQHTWKISDKEYLKNCTKIKKVKSPQRYVSV